jgi:hypothetical protein
MRGVDTGTYSRRTGRRSRLGLGAAGTGRSLRTIEPGAGPRASLPAQSAPAEIYTDGRAARSSTRGVLAGDLFDRPRSFSTRHSGERWAGMKCRMGRRVLEEANRDLPGKSTPVSTCAARAIAVRPVRQRSQPATSAPAVPTAGPPHLRSLQGSPTAREGLQRSVHLPRLGRTP